MLRGSSAALFDCGAPVAKLMMLPLSEPASSLFARLSCLSSKVSRFRHHIINLQTYLSCKRPLSTLIPNNVAAFTLDGTEDVSWKSTRISAGLKFCAVAVRSARRHLQEALQDFKGTVKKLRSLHCVEATQVELRVRSNVDRLDNTLSRTRAKKWARDGIAPRPLRIFLKRRGRRGGKRHAR